MTSNKAALLKAINALSEQQAGAIASFVLAYSKMVREQEGKINDQTTSHKH